MKISKLIQAGALAAILASGMAQAAPVELIVNGNFETTVNGDVDGYRVVGSGSGDIVGWTVGNTSVDLIKGGYGAISGNSIDMLGTPGPGALSQAFSTVAGTNYLLSFDLSRNGGDSSLLSVSFNGGAQTTFTGTDTITHYTVDYTATSASTTLEFLSANVVANSGAVIDNVSVVSAVPEPETYGMLLAGLGLLGFIGRRKAAKQAA